MADLAGDVTIGVTSLADAGVASLADLAGSVAGEVTFVADPVGVVTDGVTFLEGCSAPRIRFSSMLMFVTTGRTVLFVMNRVMLTIAQI